MLRSLYTAAAGMMSQQTHVDVIANNLANVNTVGYKAESTEFKSLLYQDLQARTTTANGEFKPVSAQVGLGSRVASITSHYTQGSANSTESNTDFRLFCRNEPQWRYILYKERQFLFCRGRRGFHALHR